MKPGKSLTELAKQLETIKETAKDYLVPTSKLRMNHNALVMFEDQIFRPNDWSHGQISDYAEVPKSYYERLREENPSLLGENVNHGLKKNEGIGRNGKTESRMVRTIGEDMRAFVSSSYKRMDSYDLMNEVLPVMLQKQMEVVSCEITEKRTYLKAVFPKLQAEIKAGDAVQYGLVVSNSDVGAGSLRIEPLIYRLICLNGMITSHAIKKFHLGRNMAGEDIQELLSASTNELTENAFWSQVRDVILGSLREEIFQEQVDRIRVAANEQIQNFDIPRVIELSMKATGIIGEKTKDNMVAYLANGADGAGLTKWGLVNAYTYAAQDDSVNYDQSVELERAGSKILELSKHTWSTIAGKEAA